MTLGISPHSTRQNVSKLVAFRRGWVSLSQHFRESGRPLGIFFGWRKTKHIMVALCNRADHYIFILFLSSFFFFSSPNLSGRRLDVYHTLAHGVALVRI